MNAIELVNQAKDTINVRRVYGEPYQEDGLTIIPAANVMGGGGAGGDTEGNGGGGFGVRARPAGAWVIKDGEATWRPAMDLNRTILMGQLVAIVALLSLRSIVKAIAARR
ncbi:MAG: sporulation protein [Chloroflexi bacterium]|nr:MAG: sporulation protein [Chloroflexota bacterium]TMG70629.1 MAG: sporulation protein [Chloroflexota bacterium]